MKRDRIAQRIRVSLDEAVEHAQGVRVLNETSVPIGKQYTANDVMQIRRRKRMSQVQFATLLAVSVRTLQSWEQGARVPSRASMRLLQILDQPEEFRSLLLIRETEVDYSVD